MRSLKVLALGFIIGAAPAVWAQSNPSSATPAKPADSKAKPAAAAPTKPAAQPSKPASTPAGKPRADQAPAPTSKAPAQKPQAPASNPQAAKPQASTPKPQSAKPQAPAPKPQAVAKAPTAKPQAKKPATKAASKKKPVERPASTATASSSAPEGEVPKGARRDPFESLISRQQNAANASKLLPPGKAGLQVSTLRLDGIVKAPNGMIAVVTNPQSRTYFLREGDQLYDGRVEKIAMDGVSFHEVGKDAFGKPIERQVQKRIYSSTPGEQQ